MKSIYLRQWEVRHFLTLAPGERMQIRRPVKPQPEIMNHDMYPCDCAQIQRGNVIYWKKRFFCLEALLASSPLRPGDRFEGRETWCEVTRLNDCEGKKSNLFGGIDSWYYYKADGKKLPDGEGFAWHSPVCQPPAAVRIYGLCKAVRVERLSFMREEDALACSAELTTGEPAAGSGICPRTRKIGFKQQWENDYPAFPFESAWAWVYDVERVRP